MELSDLEPILDENQVGVLTTFRRDGRPQMSPVTTRTYQGQLALTTQRRSAKARNLVRDPRCAILLSKPNFRGYAVVDGDAEVRGSHNTDSEELRLLLREVYRAAAGKEHPDWDEYDQAMVEQDRVVILIEPSRIYGTSTS